MQNNLASYIRTSLPMAAPVLLVTHTVPDGDAAGTAVALYHLLKYYNPELDISILHDVHSPLRRSVNELYEFARISLLATADADASGRIYNCVYVDCSPTESNLPALPKLNTTLAIFDHHANVPDPIDASQKASASVLFRYMSKDIMAASSPLINTALYYALWSDTNKFEAPLAKYDKELRTYLECSQLLSSVLVKLQGCSSSLSELDTISQALRNISRLSQYPHVAFIDAGVGVAQPTLGRLADMLVEADEVTIAIAYSKQLQATVRVSVRAYDTFFRADEIISFICSDGGGHAHKAGGVIGANLLRDRQLPRYLLNCIENIYNTYTLVGNAHDLEVFAHVDTTRWSLDVSAEFYYLDLSAQFPKGALIQTPIGEVHTDNAVLLSYHGHMTVISKDYFTEMFYIDSSRSGMPIVLKHGNNTFFGWGICRADYKQPCASVVELQSDAKIVYNHDKFTSFTAKSGSMLITYPETCFVINLPKEDFQAIYRRIK